MNVQNCRHIKEKGWKWNQETHQKEKKIITILTYELLFFITDCKN